MGFEYVRNGIMRLIWKSVFNNKILNESRAMAASMIVGLLTIPSESLQVRTHPEDQGGVRRITLGIPPLEYYAVQKRLAS